MASIVIKKPSECSKGELDEFEALVKKGSEVISAELRERIMRAERLIFLMEGNNTLAGVAALKNPSPVYKKRVFEKAGSKENPNDYGLEAGWIYVEEEFRGRKYSRLLLETLLKLSEEKPVYATTRENNDRMRHTNIYCGLQQSGEPYSSDQGDHKLVLYIKRSL